MGGLPPDSNRFLITMGFKRRRFTNVITTPRRRRNIGAGAALDDLALAVLAGRAGSARQSYSTVRSTGTRKRSRPPSYNPPVWGQFGGGGPQRRSGKGSRGPQRRPGPRASNPGWGAAGRNKGKLRKFVRNKKSWRKKSLSVGWLKAISAIQYGPYEKTTYSTEVGTGAVGKCEWRAFELGSVPQIHRLYENHTAALAPAGYLANPYKRMVADCRMKITLVNATNVPQFYKIFVYKVKKNYTMGTATPLAFFEGNWLNSTIDGSGLPVDATGETNTKVLVDDVNAMPGMNKAWSLLHKQLTAQQKQLGPGESYTIDVGTKEKWFNPMQFNHERATVIDNDDQGDMYKQHSLVVLVRTVGTIVADTGTGAVISTSATHSKYICRRDYKSQIVSTPQPVITNTAKLPTVVAAPRFMGAQQDGIQNFASV